MKHNSPVKRSTENIQINILDYIPYDIMQFLYNGNLKAGRISINRTEWNNLVKKIVTSFIYGTNPIDELSHDLKVRVYAEATKALAELFEPAEFFKLLNETLLFIHAHKRDTTTIKLHLKSLNGVDGSKMCLLLTVLKHCIIEAEKNDKMFSYCRILIEAELKSLSEYQNIQHEKQNKGMPEATLQKESLTLSEAAKYLSMSESYLYKLTSNRTIEFSKPGGKVIYFKREVLDKFILRNPIKHQRLIETESNTIAALPKATK
jgi:excisionase family DNA binding protein